MPRLTGQQIEQIRDALLSAFEEDDLHMMVRIELDQELPEIAGGKKLATVAYNLVIWAERNGAMHQLVAGACSHNAGNPDLQALAVEFRQWMGMDAHVETGPGENTKGTHEPVIDRVEAIERFHALLNPDLPQRYLRLQGAAKMGKSHLLTKIYPKIAAAYDVEWVVLDLRTQQITIIDHLHYICGKLGREKFEHFNRAYDEWLARTPFQEGDLETVLTQMSKAASQGVADERERTIPYFTRCFVSDLRQCDDRRLVLIFDAVEQASKETQRWLIDNLLIQLCPLQHVHVVAAGRNTPSPSDSYLSICTSHELRAVTDHAAYVEYCHELGAGLSRSAIEALAQAFDYVPGQFANVLSTRFLSGSVGHD